MIDPRVDLEGLASGFDTLALLAAYRGQANPADDAETLRVRTPSGGLHIWYRLPSGMKRYRSSTGSSRKVALAWQVDVRAENGYVVAPGIHTASGSYEALSETRLPAILPAWLAEELARTGHVIDAPGQITQATHHRPLVPNSRVASGERAFGILAPLLADVEACAGIPEGAGFTEKLNRAAFTAGGLVGAGQMAEGEAWRLLNDAAQKARPSQQGRNARIMSAGFYAGTKRPLRVAIAPRVTERSTRGSSRTDAGPPPSRKGSV